MHSTPEITPTPVTALAPRFLSVPQAARVDSSRKWLSDVEEQLDPLAHEELSAGAMTVDVFLPAAHPRLGLQRLELGHAFAQRFVVGDEVFAAPIDPGGEHLHDREATAWAFGPLSVSSPPLREPMYRTTRRMTNRMNSNRSAHAATLTLAPALPGGPAGDLGHKRPLPVRLDPQLLTGVALNSGLGRADTLRIPPGGR